MKVDSADSQYILQELQRIGAMLRTMCMDLS